MRIKFLFAAILLFLMPLRHVHWIDLDTQQRALNIIGEFANSICSKIPLEGGSIETQLSGEAKAELNNILNRLADLGVKGSAEFTNKEYRNVLQNELAKVIIDSNNCRLVVFFALKDKFLLTEERTSPNQSAPTGSGGSSPAPARSEIVIGAPYPEKGDYKSLGGPVRDGIEKAVEDWNRKEKYGVLKDKRKFIVEWRDDKCEGPQASVAANELIKLDKPVQVVIGHNCSGAALAAAPIYNSRGLVMISTSATNPDLTKADYDFVFRMVGRDDDQADAAASFIAGNPRFQNVAILYDNQPYGLRLAELMRSSLRARNITEVMFTQLDPPDDHGPSFKAYDLLISRMRDSHVDVVYYAGYPQTGVPLRKKTWEQNFKVPIVSGDGFLHEDYSKMVGEDAAASTFITNTPRSNPAADNVVMELEAKGKTVLPQTLHTYAAVDVWAQAVKLAGTTEAVAIARELRRAKFKTVIGEIRFDQKGDRSDFEPFFVWYTWRNGTYTKAVKL